MVQRLVRLVRIVRLVGVATLVAAAACSSSSSPSAPSSVAPSSSTAASTTSASSTSSSSAPGASAPYAGYTSRVYSKAQSWLCRPDARPDYCATNLDVTVVQADGSTQVQHVAPTSDAKFDCFYVYPTISEDQTVNADMHPGAEIPTVRSQFARYSTVCRVFAPIYRQVTLHGLFGGQLGGDAGKIAFDTALDAWKQYLAHDNRGRGVVLVGHSQGSGIIKQLLQKIIEPDPAQRRLIISAIIPGTSIAVPDGKDVGGDFKDFPLCRSATQTGCVIGYSSFRSTAPPPPNSFFGRVRSGNGIDACTNPGALSGGVAPLRPIFATGNAFEDQSRNASITTPWVELPGIVTGQCVQRNGFSYLEVTLHVDAHDVRTHHIAGDLTPEWGLHLIDLNVAQADLVDVVRQEGAAYVAASSGG